MGLGLAAQVGDLVAQDVAGGRGDLACEVALRGMPVTLVDPRCKILNKGMRRR